MSFVINNLINKKGKSVKIRKATSHYDPDRGTDYTTYDKTITTKALITNIRGYREVFYPYAKAYEGDYLAIFKNSIDIDVADRILYNDKEYKINEIHNREEFIETVLEVI